MPLKRCFFVYFEFAQQFCKHVCVFLHVHVTNCVGIPIVIIIVKGILIKTHVNIMNKNGYVWLKSFVIKVKYVWWRWHKLDNWIVHYHKCHNPFTFSSFYHIFKIFKKTIKFYWMTHFINFSIPIFSFIVISVGNKIDCKLRLLMVNGILINIFKLYIN